MFLQFQSLFHGPGLSFAEGRSQVSQMFWDTTPLPLFWKGHSQAQSSFLPSRRWWRRWGTWTKEIYPSGFVTWVKCVIVSGCVRHLPAIEGANINWGRRYWGRFWRLRRFPAIFVGVFGVICYCYCCQDVKGIGRQVQVVQVWGNNWKLPSKTIWHCGLIWIVIDCHNLWFRRCNWWYRDHFWGIITWYLCEIDKNRRFGSGYALVIGWLFHNKNIRVCRIQWWTRCHLEGCKVLKIKLSDHSIWFQWRKIGRVISIAGKTNPLSRSEISFDVPAPLLSIIECRKSRVQFKLMRCKQIARMESLNLRNTWVWFHKVSLKMHADVIAGRQINQTS